MVALHVFLGLLVISNSCWAKDLHREKREGDLFGSLGTILNQLTNAFGGNKNGNGNANSNSDANAGSPPVGPRDEQVQPPHQGGPEKTPPKTVYCDDNPADCAYLTCLAENFQHSENSNTLKMGGKVLTDPKLRQALENDPMVSQAACDKIKLSSQGCDGFKQFLQLVDKINPGDGGNPRDPNAAGRKRRSPDALKLGTNTNVGVLGTNANVNSNANLGVGNTKHQTSTPTTTRSTSRSTSRASSGSGSGHSSGQGSGKGHGSVDYTDFYDNGGSSGHGSGSGSGSSGGSNSNNQPAYVQKDCNALLPKNAQNGNTANSNVNNGNSNGNKGKRVGKNNGNNGNHNGQARNGNMENNRGH